MPSVNLSGVDLGPAALPVGTAELIGTFILVIIGGGAAITSPGSHPLAFGFGMMALVIALGRISGAHLNPAVTLALTFTGHLKTALAPIYIVAQFVGGILAAAVLRLAFGGETTLGASQLGQAVNAWAGFTLELVMAAVFVFVIHAVMSDRTHSAAASGIAIGGAYLAINIMLVRATGGAINPARAFGLALLGNQWADSWVFLIAPFIGAILGGFLWEVIGHAPTDSSRNDAPTESIDELLG